MDNRNYTIYAFSCDWIDLNEQERHSQGLTMASSLHEAVEAIENRLPDCWNLNIRQWDDCRFVFLNETLFEKFLDPDNECGLEFPEWDLAEKERDRFDSDAEDDEEW